MRKKLCVFALTLILYAGAYWCTGCGLFDKTPQYKDVATYAELMEKSKSPDAAVRLTADIDCDYASTEGIGLTRLDGNGFSIKNLTMTAAFDHVSLFGDVEEIKNVTFSGLTVTASNPYDAALICRNAGRLENVRVTDSTLVSKQKYGKSGILMRYYDLYAGGIAVEAQEMTNCTLENVTIAVEGRDTSKETVSNTADLYVGGLAATTHAVTGCRVADCEFSVTSGAIHNIPYGGGFAATAKGTIESSCAENNAVTVKASWRSYTEATKTYSTSTAYAGGFAANASSASVRYSYASGNTLSVTSSGGVYCGGFFGSATSTPVTQSYAVNNVLKGSGYITDNKDKVTRLYGGISASHASSAISSSFAYGNRMSDTNDLRTGFEQDVKEGGLVASSASMVLSRCAVKNSLESAVGYTFTYPLGFSLNDCYSDKGEPAVTNGAPLTDAEWLGEGLKEKLNLLGNWTFEDGKLPRFVFA